MSDQGVAVNKEFALVRISARLVVLVSCGHSCSLSHLLDSMALAGQVCYGVFAYRYEARLGDANPSVFHGPVTMGSSLLV
jgi:hypothetical protein